MTLSRYSPFGSRLKWHVPFHPWIYFFIFLVSNTLLSFGQLNLPEKLWIGLGGIILPLLTGIHAIWEIRNNKEEKPPTPNLDTEPIPAWLWVLAISLLLFTRSYRLTTLPFWPLSDEGTSGVLGMDQSQHWHWNLFWGQDRVEPFFIWFLGLYFKLIQPSLFSLRLVAVLFSIATCATAYWAARRYLNSFSSFVFFLIFISSFWELTLSRNSMIIIPVPLFQCLCLGFLGGFLRDLSPSNRWKNLWCLSFFGTAGFYTWTNWAGVWLGLACVLCIDAFGYGGKDKKGVLAFGALTALGIIPLVLARLAPGELDHMRHLVTFNILKPMGDYLNGIFWDGLASFPFGSNWGGFFNPILDSLIFLGFIHLLYVGNQRVLTYGTVLLFFSTLPGFLTNNIDLYRVLPLFPILTALATLGLQSLVFRNKKRGQWISIFLLVLGGSFGLDAYNYVFHYCDPFAIPTQKRWRSVEYYNAYNILSDLNQRMGPLYIFSEFNMDYDNKTLNVACYPYDALQKTDLVTDHPRWAVLFCNLDYTPFLQKKFPGLKSSLLNPHLQPGDLHHSLGIFLIPSDEIRPETLAIWIKAHEVYREVNLNIKNKNPLSSWEQFVGPLASIRDLSKSDPFLDSIYWEKVASFQIMAGDFPAAAHSYQKALQEGYPMDHLRHNLARAQQLAENKGTPRPLH
jgi:hypothetical protein